MPTEAVRWRPAATFVTQNGLPFLQAFVRNYSPPATFCELLEDASAQGATTPSYFGDAMSYGWASDNDDLRQCTSGRDRVALRRGRRLPDALREPARPRCRRSRP